MLRMTNHTLYNMYKIHIVITYEMNTYDCRTFSESDEKKFFTILYKKQSKFF